MTTAFHTEKIQLNVDGSLVRGTFYTPSNTDGPFPVIVMAHGWGMVSGGDLEDYAAGMVAADFAALTFDFRHLGASEGEPRQDIDPHRQVEDYKAAISYVRARPEVDGERIGVWGSSYSGGHALVVAAVDRRVRCVVAQVPTISGWRAAQQRLSPAELAAQQEWFIQDRDARFGGAIGQTIKMISANPSEKVAYPGAESYDYMSARGKTCPSWRNEVTVRSLELARTYEPGAYIERIAPTPLLMIIADADSITPTGLQQDAYRRAHHPKRLLMVPGGHYSVYTDHFEDTRKAAADWFSRHLGSVTNRQWSDEAGSEVTC
ncbi:alpha/beta hydrolase [Arthrobacter sp. I2-34]|uniref:Alpha/beta hydrolase n=1 Tax=Arthrobacter hankyongi TaxID=2904801 RepID=A0ABS9L592_9MICC|nr:alpha/beta hydrolase [Arthrobacter hankyongi]MCG2621833.1 alpha/beta hydrolase [Arthrobacter hankyongi]